MLSPAEISIYLSELSKDLSLSIAGKQYFVNKDLSSSLSKFISSKIQENKSITTIEIPSDDNYNVFSMVSAFLNGKKVQISSDNDFPLDNFANLLEIPTLKKLTDQSLQSPLAISNIIQRILFKIINEDEALQFLESNVEQIIKSQKIFELQPSILEKIIHSENSSFSSPESRYLFALKCCVKFPDSIKYFITDEDCEKIPDDILLQMSSNDSYSSLDGQIPTLLISRKLIKDIENLNQEIENAMKECSKTENDLNKAKEENQRILNEKGLTESKKDEVFTRKMELSQKLFQAGIGINKKAPDLSRFIVNKSVLNQINSKLSFLDQKCEELKKVLIGIQGQKVVFPELRVNGLKMAERFEATLKPLHDLFEMLLPNSDEVNELIEELRTISKELQQMADHMSH